MQASSAAPQIAGVVGEFDEHVVIDRSRRLLVEVIVGSDSHQPQGKRYFSGGDNNGHNFEPTAARPLRCPGPGAPNRALGAGGW